MSDADCTVEYREIPEYPDYLIGNDGSVWSKRRKWSSGKEWQQLKCGTSKKGYKTVDLRNANGKRKQFVHRIVLLAFKGPCPDGQLTRHLDGNPSNNSISNITYGTYSENAKDTIRHGRLKIKHFYGMDHVNHKLTPEQVADIRNSYVKQSRDHGSSALARKYKVSQAAIWNVINHKTWIDPRSFARH